MNVYIATNKDNKDVLMHYGVKGMRWGKRGSGNNFRWPWDRDDDSLSNNQKNDSKQHAKEVGKNSKSFKVTSARLVSTNKEKEIGGRLSDIYSTKRKGKYGAAYPSHAFVTNKRSEPKKDNISTGFKPKYNKKISTSKKTAFDGAPQNISEAFKNYYQQAARNRSNRHNQLVPIQNRPGWYGSRYAQDRKAYDQAQSQRRSEQDRRRQQEQKRYSRRSR